MDTDREAPHTIGWPRAILTGVVILVIGVALLVYASNAILTMHGKTRGSLVGIVTPLFFVILIAIASGLRWLQRRKLI